MRVAGLAGGDLAPGMLEEVVVEMLALPAVRVCIVEITRVRLCGCGTVVQ